LSGPLVVYDCRGKDITPLGNKECALIALLATNENHQRSRNWIKSILWSEYSPKKASASLRQTIWRLRKHFVKPDNFIQTNNAKIWLNNENVRVSRWSKGTANLLEGIDVRDDAFEDWLFDIRIHEDGLEQQLVTKPGQLKNEYKSIVFTEIFDVRNSENRIALFNYFHGRMEQWGLTEAVLLNSRSPLEARKFCGPSDFILMMDFSNEKCVTVRLENSHSESLWSCVWPISSRLNLLSANFLAIDRLVMALITRIYNQKLTPLFYAINSFFSNRVEQRENAEITFRELSSDSPVARAWYAYSLTVANAEKIKQGSIYETEVIISNMSKALEEAPGNPIVNAIAGHLYSLVFRDFVKAQHYLSIARTVDPNNKLALTLSATNANYVDKPEEALLFAHSAIKTIGLPMLDFMVDTSRLTSLTLLGKFEDAIQLGENVLIQKPNYLAVKRYLTACYHHSERYEKRDKMIMSTRQSDPAFTVDGIRQRSYPIPSQKSSYLIGQALKPSAQLGFALQEI